MDDFINEDDIPPGFSIDLIDTREAIKIAYGILWMSFIDESEDDGVAAKMARLILLDRLTHEEEGEGILSARRALGFKN